MKKNDVVTVEVTDIGIGGEGIGKVDGYTLFIKDAVIGDTVEVKVMKAKKNYGYARLMRIVKESAFRVSARCPEARRCGGCQIQEMDYRKQLEFKNTKVRNNLIRLGSVEEELLDQIMEPIAGMEEPFRYRNKAQFPIGVDKEGNLIAGFYAGRTHQIIPVPNRDCVLGVPENKVILDQILEGDKFLSYPYDSMKPFLTMLHEAANDKDVLSVKMTLYRVAKQSKVVEALIEAAENGKEVLALVELKARFDEENNIEWSRRLERAGCHVIYGLDGFKVHSKLCQITRKAGDEVQYITQIGTGNYNEKTACLYTDLSLMTADTEIAKEARRVFQALAMGEIVEHTDKLLVAPLCLQNKVLAMIDDEIAAALAGKDAYIGLKMNALTDKKIIDRLIEASCAGVKIDLIIRGICCLIPGVKDATENIRVISIVGRFLEHSRIYIFGSKGREKVYIASADYMTRNTLRRVEVAAPVCDPAIKERLLEMFRIMLNDNQKARHEDSEGNYRIPMTIERPVDAQETFYQQAYEAAASKNV